MRTAPFTLLSTLIWDKPADRSGRVGAQKNVGVGRRHVRPWRVPPQMDTTGQGGDTRPAQRVSPAQRGDLRAGRQRAVTDETLGEGILDRELHVSSLATC